jgi:RHS repeat-associated protein
MWRLDAAGQLAERQEEGARHRFEWDCFGRLKRFDNGRGKRCLYEYDALGRRVSKVEIRGGDNLAQPLGTGFLWDGDALAGEVRFSAARSELDEAFPRARDARFYLYQPGSFEPLVMQVHDSLHNGGEENSAAASPAGRGRVYYYQNDLNGAPVRLRDADGEVVWEAHYSATGMADSVATESIDQPLRLQGQYFDAESNLQYNRHRYYDPSAGIFTSQDPVGLDGGLNQYQFAPNVFGWADPLGLRCSSKRQRARLRKIRGLSTKPGNWQITGRATRSEARELAEAFAGQGFSETVTDKGVWILKSEDGLHKVRGPSLKPTDQGRNVHPVSKRPFSTTGMQMNFETRQVPRGAPRTNVHLDVEL